VTVVTHFSCGQADKHRSKTRKNNIWITTVKPFTDNGDDTDGGSDKTGAQKLEKRTPYNAWGPIPGDSAPPTDTVTDQKSFSMVEPFVPPSDDDDDDDVGGDDESGVNTPLFVRASQLISDHKSTALRRQVGVQPFTVVNRTATSSYIMNIMIGTETADVRFGTAKTGA